MEKSAGGIIPGLRWFGKVRPAPSWSPDGPLTHRPGIYQIHHPVGEGRDRTGQENGQAIIPGDDHHPARPEGDIRDALPQRLGRKSDPPGDRIFPAGDPRAVISELRADHAGADQAHRDPAAAQFPAQHVGKPPQPELGGGICAEGGQSNERRDGSDVEDATRAPLEHGRQQSPGEEDRHDQVQLN